MIRPATNDDIFSVGKIADEKRHQYAHYAPAFWNPAHDAYDKHVVYLRSLLERSNTIFLVEEDNGKVRGFVIASIIGAPPVYDPGTKICMIDDFAVAAEKDWSTVGHDLLNNARSHAKQMGANLAVVVCGGLDEAKRKMLRKTGFGVTSEWYANPL